VRVFNAGVVPQFHKDALKDSNLWGKCRKASIVPKRQEKPQDQMVSVLTMRLSISLRTCA
jgi:hypothetical protein